MLRGQASLQALLGKNEGGRSAPRGKKRKPVPKEESSSDSDFQQDPRKQVKKAKGVEKPQRAKVTKIEDDDAIPEGRVRCPVCRKLLEEDTNWINTHIGTPLCIFATEALKHANVLGRVLLFKLFKIQDYTSAGSCSLNASATVSVKSHV